MVDYTWNYNFGTNQLTFDTQEVAPGSYQIVGVSGTVPGNYTVTGLGTASTPGTTQDPDNTLYTEQGESNTSGFSADGVSLTISDGTAATAGYQYHLDQETLITQGPGGGFTVQTLVYATLYDASGNSVYHMPVNPTVSNDVPAPCYVAGTLIATPHGEVAVEALRAGDRVLTAAGDTRRVKWLGHAVVDATRKAHPQDVLPVRIRAGAIAEGLPTRDLLVSPGHAVQVDGQLVLAGDLLNGLTITQEAAGRIDYYHVELDTHELLIAHGLPAESFVEEGNRGAFVNGGRVVDLDGVLEPKIAARAQYPLRCRTDALTAITTRLARRAAELGWAFTPQDVPTLVVDGERLLPAASAGNRFWFIPGSPALAELRLQSPACRFDLIDPASPDKRRLGVSVASLRINGEEVDLTSDVLGDGFHAVEAVDGRRWRWTDGDAALRPTTRAAVVEVQIIDTTPAATRDESRATVSAVAEADEPHQASPRTGPRALRFA